MSNHTHVQGTGIRRSAIAAAILAVAIGLSAATQVAVGRRNVVGLGIGAHAGRRLRRRLLRPPSVGSASALPHRLCTWTSRSWVLSTYSSMRASSASFSF